MVVFAGGTKGHVLVTEFRVMALNGLFCVDVMCMLRPLDLVPLTDFIPTNTTLLALIRLRLRRVLDTVHECDGQIDGRADWPQP